MNTVEERQERELLPRVVLALRHAGVPDAFARYLDAGELLATAADRADRSELEDIELERSPRVERARRLVAQARVDLDTARTTLDRLLGEDSKLVGNCRGLGVALRQAPPHVLEKARPLVEEALALSGALAPRRPRDEDELEEPDPVPDPRLTKKDCSCGRRIRAYLFDEHTKTCSAVDRTPIVDRDAEPTEDDMASPPVNKIDFDMEKANALRAQGKTFGEIAKALSVSFSTVQRRLGKTDRKTTAAPPKRDLLDEVVAERTEKNPEFPKLVEEASRKRHQHYPAKDLQVLAKCVDLLESLPENERRAVAYYLGTRYTTPARAS